MIRKCEVLLGFLLNSQSIIDSGELEETERGDENASTNCLGQWLLYVSDSNIE